MYKQFKFEAEYCRMRGEICDAFRMPTALCAGACLIRMMIVISTSALVLWHWQFGTYHWHWVWLHWTDVGGCRVPFSADLSINLNKCASWLVEWMNCPRKKEKEKEWMNCQHTNQTRILHHVSLFVIHLMITRTSM